MSSLLADELLASGFLEAGTISLPEIVYGADGTGIYSCNWDNSGHLTITLTDGRVFVSPSLTGSDGFSPTVAVSNITGGHRVTITDAEHPSGQSFDVLDGEDGDDEILVVIFRSLNTASTVRWFIDKTFAEIYDALIHGMLVIGLGTPQGALFVTHYSAAEIVFTSKYTYGESERTPGTNVISYSEATLTDDDVLNVTVLNEITIPTVPQNVSAFTNDAGYLTSEPAPAILVLSEDGQGGYTGEDAETGRAVNQLNVFKSLYMREGRRVLLQVPVGGSTTIERFHPLGTFNQTDGAYFPVLSGSSMTGMYVLERTGWRYVQIPATTADAALSPTSENPVQNKVIKAALDLKADSAELAAVATSGSYSDLSNTPTIPTVPQNVSAFTNDAGYLTAHQDVSGKQDKNLGTANAGKFLVVGSDGNITAVTMTAWTGGSY